jgi:hypothetical protein
LFYFWAKSGFLDWMLGAYNRTLAKVYAGLTDKQVEHLLQDKDLTEVCHDD